MALTKRAIKRLEQVQKYILAEPKRLQMGTWAIIYNVKGEMFKQDKDMDDLPDCGTVGCIAGWTALLENRKALIKQELKGLQKRGGQVSEPDIEERARKILGLDDEQAQNLFFVSYWPEPYQTAFENAETHKQRAKATVKRIKHLIKTGK